MAGEDMCLLDAGGVARGYFEEEVSCLGDLSTALSRERHRDGSRALLHIDCGTCHGTGTLPLRPRLTAAGVEVAA